MGQEVSNHQVPHKDPKTNIQYKKIGVQALKAGLRHQGLLRIGKTPFQNCQKVQIDNEIYFLESTRNNLKDMIRQKMRINKPFPEQQILKLTQNIAYTLAYLQNTNTPYPYLCSENIFLCPTTPTTFKLLPPQCIKTQLYQKLKQIQKQKSNEYVPASPEMVIALRCRQNEITQKQILYKSNVFAFGLTLLEVCTLRDSKDCFDLETYDILDQVVNERIEEVEARYSDKVARFIANMLDYDFEERMDPKELSIWINRQINEPEVEINNTPAFAKEQIKLQNAEMIKSRLIEQPQVHKSRVKLQITSQPIKMENFPSKRINQIRNKILKQKIKAEKDIVQQNNLTKSRRNLSHTKNTSQRQRDKNLPNPYLNHAYIQSTSNIKQTSTPYYNPSLSRPKATNSRYLYTQAYEQDPILVSDRERECNMSPSYINAAQVHIQNINKSKQFNLKYKYNVEEEEGESARLSSNRKRDSERFVRVEKCIAEYQRAGSQKKNQYGYSYGVQRAVSKSPVKRIYTEHTASISDFSFEPQKPQQKALLRSYPQQPAPEIRVLAPKPSNNESQRINQPQVQQKEKKDRSSNFTMQGLERHQQLFGGDNNQSGQGHRRNVKQSEDMRMIKKQIERSRKLIQQVRRSQKQNEKY